MSDAVSVTVDRAQLIEAIRNDCATALAFYIGEELDMEVPDFHIELWDEFLELLDQVNHPEFLVGKLQKLLAVPREHAKTTLVKVAIVIFLRYSKLGFVAYVSKTFGNALNALKDIRDFLTSPNEIELYGKPHVETARENDGLFILHIAIPGREGLKEIIMQAFGQGTHIRGRLIKNKRPDFLIFDDIEDRDTIEPSVQEKLDSWAMGTAIKAMARRGVVVFIGNMISDTTLLARLSKDPEWNPTIFGAIIRTADGVLRPLWEGRWTLEALLLDYAKYRKIGLGHVWEAEMMNLTHQGILGESLAGALRPPMPSPELIEAGFLCLDPAFGLKAWNDESAITVHVRLHGASIPMVARTEAGRMTEMQVFEKLVDLSMYWGINTWVIEAQAAQRLLMPLFKAYCLQRGIAETAFVMLPVYAGRDSKASRIVAFRSSVSSGSYGIVEDEQDLVERLEKYSPDTTEHDDRCDSAAYGTQVWSLYGQMVTALGVKAVAGMITNGDGSGDGNLTEIQICPF